MLALRAAGQFRVATAIAFLVLSCDIRSARAAEPTPREQCFNRGYGSMAEYRNCVAKLEEEEARQLRDHACNETVCIYRLNYVSDGLFSGNGYTIKHRVSSVCCTIFRSLLIGPNGQQAVMEQSCGSSCPMDPTTVGGDILWAAYHGPFGVGEHSYIVLQLPAPVPADAGSNRVATSDQCQDQKAEQTTLPCGLMSRTVDYRFDVDRVVARGGTILKSFDRFVERIRFTKTDDVYQFIGDRQRAADEGFVYKLGKEVDFNVNRLRAPQNYPTNYFKFDKGMMTFGGDLLTRRRMNQNNNGESLSSVLQIRFSPDRTKCSVAEYSATGFTGDFAFKQQIECSVK
jgi:hypothetical protein